MKEQIVIQYWQEKQIKVKSKILHLSRNPSTAPCSADKPPKTYKTVGTLIEGCSAKVACLHVVGHLLLAILKPVPLGVTS